jgi:cell division protease FtsH
MRLTQHIDQEICRILDTAYNRAQDIITKQQHKLETLAKTLLDIETVDRPQFEALMA